MQTTYIFGHKKPDTDSVCSSICLAYLKNQIGLKSEPRVLGTINNESKFVLDYWNEKTPRYLNDVKVQIRNMNYNKNCLLRNDTSIKKSFDILSDLKVTGLPIVDEEQNLMGYVNLKEISKFLINGKLTRLVASYNNVVDVLEGKEILRFDDNFEGTIMATTFKVETIMEKINFERKHIVIVGDRTNTIKFLIAKGVQLIILVGNYQLPADLLELAKEHKINIISTPFLAYKTSNKLRLATNIISVEVNKDPISFKETDYRDDFLETAKKYGHTNYPVVDKENKCLGMLKLVDRDNYEKKPIILVDHNQKTQSVDGIEEAEILEIIDHHNLGTIGTNTPINFRSMPVGCTCTLIYKIFKESLIMIPKNIAGLMLSAIISDTLAFKSPTTTKIDIEIGNKLAEIAGIDIEKYSYEMFKAGSSISGMTYNEIITQDFKSFNIDDVKIGIGQINTMDIEAIQNNKQDYINLLNNYEEFDYKIALFFVTDIIKNGSYIYFNESSKNIIEEVYQLENIEQGTFIPNMVSRKKQMLPGLLEYFTNKI